MIYSILSMTLNCLLNNNGGIDAPKQVQSLHLFKLTIIMVLEHLLEVIEERIQKSSLYEPLTLADLRLIVVYAIALEEKQEIKKQQEEDDAFNSLDHY